MLYIIARHIMYSNSYQCTHFIMHSLGDLKLDQDDENESRLSRDWTMARQARS